MVTVSRNEPYFYFRLGHLEIAFNQRSYSLVQCKTSSSFSVFVFYCLVYVLKFIYFDGGVEHEQGRVRERQRERLD